MHIYTNGVDPFTFKVKSVVVHVHTGAAPAPALPTPLPPPLAYTPLPPTLAVRAASGEYDGMLEAVDGPWDGAGKVIPRVESDGVPLSQLDSVLDGVENFEDEDIVVLVFDVNADND
jgi:hypothetical protein